MDLTSTRLPVGPDLDDQAHRDVMHFCSHPMASRTHRDLWPGEADGVYDCAICGGKGLPTVSPDHLHPYSTDTNYAWRLIDKVCSEGWQVVVKQLPPGWPWLRDDPSGHPMSRDDRPCLCEIEWASVGQRYRLPTIRPYDHGYSPAEAITRACIRLRFLEQRFPRKGSI